MQNNANFTVLYVEDDKDAAEEILFNLKRNYTNIIHAEDGKMGLELFRAYRPNIVISDIKMPNMDGISLGRAIKSISKDVPILFLSAYSDSEYLQSAINVGAEGYISRL